MALSARFAKKMDTQIQRQSAYTAQSAVYFQVRQGETISLIGRNEDGAWYQFGEGEWLAAFLVDGVSPDALDVVDE